jgi:hypothetical protein
MQVFKNGQTPTQLSNTSSTKPMILTMSSTSSAPSSPHFSLLEIPSSPAQSVAALRLYGFCYKVKTTRKSDTITSYTVELNPQAKVCPSPCNKDCSNN